MAGFVDNLLEFFQDFLRCIREGIAELNLEYEPNRVGSLLDQLTEFERTLGLISSRVAGHESSDQLLQDLHQLTDTVRVLKERYQNRHVESNYFSFNMKMHICGKIVLWNILAQPVVHALELTRM